MERWWNNSEVLEKILSHLHLFHNTDWPRIELGREQRPMPSLMVV